MKHVPTCSTPLTWQLLLRTNDAVADTTLGLSLQGGGHVLSPSHQSLDETPSIAFVGEVNDALSRDQPRAPFLLVDADAVDGIDSCTLERVRWRKVDRNGHCLFVDGDGSGDLAG